jgi:hypothetical protein
VRPMTSGMPLYSAERGPEPGRRATMPTLRIRRSRDWPGRQASLPTRVLSRMWGNRNDRAVDTAPPVRLPFRGPNPRRSFERSSRPSSRITLSDTQGEQSGDALNARMAADRFGAGRSSTGRNAATAQIIRLSEVRLGRGGQNRWAHRPSWPAPVARGESNSGPGASSLLAWRACANHLDGSLRTLVEAQREDVAALVVADDVVDLLDLDGGAEVDIGEDDTFAARGR